MNYLKKISVACGITFLILLSLTIILSILSFYNAVKGNFVEISKILIPIISFLIGGLIIGKKSTKKGWLEGLKLGLILVILMIIFSFLAFANNFELKNLVYYIILIITSSLGSMIGINFKKRDSN